MATFSEKAAFELRAEGRGGADSSPSTEESGAAGRGNSKGKGPETAASFAYQRSLTPLAFPVLLHSLPSALEIPPLFFPLCLHGQVSRKQKLI